MLASFVIFKSDNKKRAPAWLLYFLVLFSLFFLIVVCREFNYLSDILISSLLTIACLANIIYIVYCYVSYQPLHGELDGHLEFGEDYFVIEGIKTKLAEINKIDLAFLDYYGRSTTLRVSIEKRLSQGVGNFFEVTNQAGTYRIYFVMFNENEKEAVYPFIEKAILLERISFLRGTELMGINDYEDIQQFKKKLYTSNF